MLVGSRQKLSQLPTALTLEFDTTSINLSTSVKNLGVILDNTLSMQAFVSRTVQSCPYQLRRISQIRKYLSTEATVKLVITLILTRIDYCNSLLSNLPASTSASKTTLHASSLENAKASTSPLCFRHCTGSLSQKEFYTRH